MKTYKTLSSNSRSFAKKIFDDIANSSRDPEFGFCRPGYSSIENAVHDYFKALGQSLNLEINVDYAGNLFMTLPGRDRNLPCYMTGSHADSVPHGGNFDGLAGVVAALTVVQSLIEQNIVLERDTTVVIFRMEESSWFGKAYVGSLAMVGKLKPEELSLKHREQDITLQQAIERAGFIAQNLVNGIPTVNLSQIAAFTELHIEQGPTLDSDTQCRVGIVTGIRGNIRHKKCLCAGERAHSGAVDRQFRHDPVFAFAQVLEHMDRHWEKWLYSGKDLVMTSGVIHTDPSSAISIIPGEISFSLDIRSLSEKTLNDFYSLFAAECAVATADRGVSFSFDRKLVTEPAQLDRSLIEHLFHSASVAGVTVRKIASGAGHDAAVLANAGIPSSMVFVANQEGSHNPNEKMQMDDFMLGTEVLHAAISEFDNHQ